MNCDTSDDAQGDIHPDPTLLYRIKTAWWNERAEMPVVDANHGTDDM